MCNIRDHESMVVKLVCDKPETASATASSSRVVIGTESHHVIISVEQSFLDCGIVIDIVDISEARIDFLHSLSAHAAVGFWNTYGVEGERVNPIAGIEGIQYLIQRQT